MRLKANPLHMYTHGLRSQDEHYQAHQLTTLIQRQGKHLFSVSSSKRLIILLMPLKCKL